ncbi:YcxB family protein [Methylibium rhizosphaerae]|uniref:YcxB family protein n=1 Tax=Methylibium rhizosphaerae TaxID=2570323 RepID=UPI00112C42FB|nr:YcxB family protein [Methylibium rhizosphaerae]
MQTPNKMIAQGTISERDYVASQFLHLRPRPALAVVGLVLVALFAVGLVVARSVAMWGVAAYLVGLFAVYIPWNAKRTYRQYKAIQEPVIIETSEEGLRFRRPNAQEVLPWSHVRKWRHSKHLVVLYPTANIFHLVPSHFFATQQLFGEFVAALKERIGDAT